MFSIQSQSDGGFMSSQATQQDFGPSPAKSRVNDQRLTPVTVKQISEASHTKGEKSDNYQIDGVDVTNVKLVGIVYDKVEKVTDVTFSLDDGTGRIECKRWINEPYDKKQMEAVEDGAYVRLIGHLRSFQNRPQVSVFSSMPVIDFNEVTHHFVECVHNHLTNVSLPPKAESLSQAQPAGSQSTPMKLEPNGFQSTPPNQVSLQMNAGLKDVDQMVLAYLQQPSSQAQEKGIHRSEIAQNLKLPVEKIAEAINVLEDEGLIYSTIDEFHFKSAS